MKGCRPLSGQEVSEVIGSIFGTFAGRDKALVILGTKSGFRISELLSLRIGDIIQAGQLVDKVTVRRAKMKKKIEGRTVLLHPEAKSALVAWIDELRALGYMDADSYVFQSRKGANKSISRVQAYRIINGAAAEAGLTGRIGTHTMRKTFANNVYRRLLERRAAGEAIDPFRLTSKALGHKNINSTDSYLSFMEADIDDAVLAS